MALLRGANRPLLTKLIMQEVENEMRKGLRDKVDIDYTSERVIQCAGDLAQLEYDDVVRSIGCGNTDKLTTFGENDQTMKPPQKPSLVRDEEPQQPPIIEEGTSFHFREFCRFRSHHQQNCNNVRIQLQKYR